MPTTQTDLDNAITNLTALVTKVGEDITAAVDSLQAKLGASPVLIDYTSEMNQLSALASRLTAIDTTVLAAAPAPVTDPAPAPVTEPAPVAAPAPVTEPVTEPVDLTGPSPVTEPATVDTPAPITDATAS